MEPLASWARSGEITLSASSEQHQRWWGDKQVASRHHSLLQRSSGRDIVRLEALQYGVGTGQLMLCAPSPIDQACITPSDYTLLLRWHLGIPLIPVHFGGTRCAACGRASDPFGDHAAMCPCSSIFDRHLGVQNTLCRVLEAGVAHSREKSIDGSLSRPADILLPGFWRGQDVAVDITVVHPLQVHRPYGLGSATRALDDAAREKRRAHGEACERVGVRFEPLVLDTWGGVHGTGKQVWRAIQLAATKRLRPNERTQRLGALKRSLSLAVVRTVARQLASLATVTAEFHDTPGTSPDDDFALQEVVPDDLDGTADDMVET